MTWPVPIERKTERMFPRPLSGRIERHPFPSRVLQDNPLGDPADRELPVYIPPSGKTEGRPLLVLLSGYTGAGWMHFERSRWLNETRVVLLDHLIRAGRLAESVLVAPDCLTTLGGSQYLNSTATGQYEDYLVQEILPWVREKYHTGPMGVLGTSSGGYGALVMGLRHPDLFPAVASNAGDCYFEYGYLPEFPIAAREIRRSGGPDKFLARIFEQPISDFGPRNPLAITLEQVAYASCYSPVEAEPGRFDLPFDLDSGELDLPVWARWLAWDPARMIETDRYREALRKLRYVYVDGGTRDEYFLDLGARVFAARAKRQGVTVDHQEFDGVHGDGGRRYEAMYTGVLRALGFPS
ncbi:MAG: alpha/beta hydrolase-fold protein [Thermoplasmata archaeon]